MATIDSAPISAQVPSFSLSDVRSESSAPLLYSDDNAAENVIQQGNS
jgi:hypothetical protein